MKTALAASSINLLTPFCMRFLCCISGRNTWNLNELLFSIGLNVQSLCKVKRAGCQAGQAINSNCRSKSIIALLARKSVDN